jgi:hypothetical protein
MHDERESSRCDLRNRRKALLRIVGKRAVQARIHHEGIDGDQKRQTIRIGARSGLRSDVAARAGPVLGDDRRTPARAQFVRKDAREQVGPRACGEWNDDPDRLMRLAMSPSADRRKDACEESEHRAS